jgi:hypothetical protein
MKSLDNCCAASAGAAGGGVHEVSPVALFV